MKTATTKTENYDLICMSFDGEIMRDSQHEDIESASEASANMGSKWYFYPFHFIIKGETVKETGEGLVNMDTKEAFMSLMFKNKKLSTVVKAFRKAFQYCNENDIVADSYDFEEILIDQTL